MRSLIILCALALPACATAPVGLPPPSAVAGRTTLDERVLLGIEATYAAARSAAELATDAGVIRGDQALTVARLDGIAYAAVLAMRSAYQAGNSTDYLSAAANASSAVAQIVALSKGEVR